MYKVSSNNGRCTDERFFEKLDDAKTNYTQICTVTNVKNGEWVKLDELLINTDKDGKLQKIDAVNLCFYTEASNIE